MLTNELRQIIDDLDRADAGTLPHLVTRANDLLDLIDEQRELAEMDLDFTLEERRYLEDQVRYLQDQLDEERY